MRFFCHLLLRVLIVFCSFSGVAGASFQSISRSLATLDLWTETQHKSYTDSMFATGTLSEGFTFSSGMADLATGTLHISGFAQAGWSDFFTVRAPTYSPSELFTARLIININGMLYGENAGAGWSFLMSDGIDEFQADAHWWSGDYATPLSVFNTSTANFYSSSNPDYWFPSAPHSMIWTDVTFRLDQPIYAAMSIYGTHVDFSHTARLSLMLPDGMEMTSESGVFLSKASESTQIVEPPSFSLIFIGIIGMGLRFQRERRRCEQT